MTREEMKKDLASCREYAQQEASADGACDKCGGYWCHPSGLVCWNPNTGPQPNEPTTTEEG